MSTNIKRSYNNLTRSMLKIQNCFSPSSSHNKIISDINLRVSTQRNEQSNKAFHFKKQSQQIYCVNKNEIIRTEPNKNLLKVSSNRVTINSKPKQDINNSNTQHKKSFSDVNHIIQSLDNNSISSKGRNNYLSPTLTKLKTQKSKIKLMNYNVTERNKEIERNEGEKYNLLLSQPLANISTKESTSTTSMKRKSSKILNKDEAVCKLSFSDNVESPEEIHFIIVNTIQRGKQIAARFDY